MTPTEADAYAQGVKDARRMALIAAVTIEARDDHREVRQQAAAAALHGFADGLQNLLIRPEPSCFFSDMNRPTEGSANPLPPFNPQ